MLSSFSSILMTDNILQISVKKVSQEKKLSPPLEKEF